MGLSTILANSKKIYNYLKGRKVNMVMTIEPQIFALTKIIQKLGFQIKKIEQQPVGRHNEMEIYLDPKNDWKNSLGLSYYSNSML